MQELEPDRGEGVEAVGVRRPYGRPAEDDVAELIEVFTKAGTKISVRPSGTEPKIKFYFGVKGQMNQPGDYQKVNEVADKKIDDIIRELKIN